MSTSPLMGAPILVTTDLTEGSVSAAHYALALARRLRRPLVLVHILEISFENWWQTRNCGTDDPVQRAQLSAEMRSWFEQATGSPPDRTAIRSDHYAPALHHLAESHRAALIVMAASCKNALARALAGSRVQEIASQPPCPLLVVPRDQTAPAQNIQLLLGVDFSAISGYLLAQAQELAEQLKAQLHIVHGLAMPEALRHERGASVEILATLEQKAKEQLSALPEGTAEEHRHLLPQAGAQALGSYAAEHAVDLIIVGQTGHRGMVGDLLGSTPRALIRQAKRPILIFPPPPPPPAEA